MRGMMLKKLEFIWGLHYEGNDRLLAVTVWRFEHHAACERT
jgi:hypothetical protein